MTSPFDPSIETLTKQLDENRASAETTLNAFFDVVASELRSYLSSWVKEESKRQHAALTALSVERVSALKAELEQILAAMLQHVRTWIDHDKFWAHRPKWRASTNRLLGYKVDGGSRRGPYGGGDEKPDEVMFRGMSDLMSKFLEKYGFNFLSGRRKSVMNAMDWTDAMRVAMNKYAEAYDVYTATQRSLDEARTNKGRYEAEELWNKA